MAGDEFLGALADNRRLSEVFRKGVITAVDESGLSEDPPRPILYTLSDGQEAKTMTATQSGLAEGDTVHWVDDLDPFILGKPAGT